MSNPLTIIYITSKGHSGSTLLDLLISSHSQITSLGEIKVLSAGRKKSRQSMLERRCTCGANSIIDCLFWQRVEQLSGIPLQELDVDSEDPIIFKQHNQAIFQAAATVSGCEFIIDASKSISRLEKLVAIKDFNILPIHIVRRPGGVVYSNIKKSRRNWLAHTRKYTDNFMRTRLLLENSHSFTLYYEELALAPQQTLTKLMKWLGLSFQENQLNWKSISHHNIAGNNMRHSRSGDSQIKLDNEWEKKLSFIQKITIAWMTLPTRYFSTRQYYLFRPAWQLQGAGKLFRKSIKSWRKKIRRQKNQFKKNFIQLLDST